MKARIPIDVDLEDRLIYGLTPLRLAYVALAGLAALAAYRAAVPLPVRLPVCVLLLALAAAAGWAKYDGRHADRWIIDAARYVAGNYRLAFTIPQFLSAPATPPVSGARSESPPAQQAPRTTLISEDLMQRMRGS